MKFKKIYVEILNSCNYQCSYCYKSSRAPRVMTTSEFQLVVDKIRPYTDYIYLHVLGEPLTHPQFAEILQIAKEANLFVNITTNGSKLKFHQNALITNSVRQINISLHDAEENVPKSSWRNYLDQMIDFSIFASESIYVSLRLWNTTNTKSREFIEIATDTIYNRFQIRIDELFIKRKSNGVKLSDRIFFHSSPRFEWPDTESESKYTYKTCYALRDHIAVLSDGSVVPCCLDADANLKLGNLYSEDLNQILSNPRGLRMKEGFERHQIVEKFCSTCGFILNQ